MMPLQTSCHNCGKVDRTSRLCLSSFLNVPSVAAHSSEVIVSMCSKVCALHACVYCSASWEQSMNNLATLNRLHLFVVISL